MTDSPDSLGKDAVTAIIRDRDQWNDHLTNEISIHILAVPSWLRPWYLRRVERLRHG